MLFEHHTRTARSSKGLTLLAGIALFTAMLTAAAEGHPPEIALEFDGAGAHVDTGVTAADLGVAGNAPRTIEAWVKAAEANDHGGVFSLGAGGEEALDFSLRALREGPRPDRRAPTAKPWRGQFGGDADIDFFYATTDRWVHFALVHTGSETIVYVNGDPYERATQELDTSSAEPFRIGWWPGGEANQSFAGKIAEVRVWDHARDESELQANMHGPLEGDEDGLVGYWPLNDGQGDAARDVAAGNDGQFTGAPRWAYVRPFTTDLPHGKPFAEGEPVTFGPVELRDATGEVDYQWYFDGEPLDGETGNTLTLSSLSEERLGTYHVEVNDERDLTPVESTRSRLAKPDWPMWRFDAARTGDTPLELAEDLHLQWVRELPEPKRAWRHQWDDWGKLDFDISYTPVVKGERIFVPSNVTDSVTAYCIEDGAEQWRFYADGPVRLAPAAWRDYVYFVSDDGHLYCLNANSGELVWKFRGGPSAHHFLGNERIINMWPARGAPVVKDGVVYFAAGVWPLHGVFIYALDAESGDVVWVNDTTSSDYRKLFRGPSYGGIAPQGYIAAGKDRLVVAGGRTPPVFLDRHTGEFLDEHFTTEKPAGDYAVYEGGLALRRDAGPPRSDDAPNPASMRAYGRWDADIDAGTVITNAMLMDRIEALDEQIGGEVFYKLAARDRLFLPTACGTLYCFGPDEAETVRHGHDAAPVQPESADWAPIAQEIIDELGETEGYGLMLGAGSGDLLRELLVRSDLHMVVVDGRPEKVRALRDELAQADQYGRRAAVIETGPAEFSVQPYLFSLVVSENADAAGLPDDVSALENILDRLRPYGGVAWLGGASGIASTALAAEADQVSVEQREDAVFATRGGPLTGAGQWTHQHQDPANTLTSHDDRVRLPLGVLWFGGPSYDNVLPRHAGGPRPQISAGRQIFLGVETISARCVYTGRELWEQEFPGIGHPFTDLEREAEWNDGHLVRMANIPGATYIGSPFVSLSDAVYLRHEGRIHRLDPRTGETAEVFSLPGRPVEAIYGDDAPDWGHISIRGDVLVTTNEPHIFEDQELGWTDSYSGTSSRLLIGMDRYDGEILWTREADIGFRHNAIVSSDDTLFVVDGLSENAVHHLARRGEEPEERSHVFALDLHTGEELWREESDVFGTYLIYSAEHETLIEGGSQDLRRPFEDEPRVMTARNGADGEILWESGHLTLPGAIHGDMLIPGRPGTARSILTGEDWMREQPHTGERSGWRYSRSKGCSTLNASNHLLLYRSTYAAYFDLEYDTGTGFFSGFAAGCTANMIAADGVLNALDYRRTCTCHYPHQTSLAMIHMPEDSNIEAWTRYDASAPDPEGYGLNFGAPGRRVDRASGRVWHHRDGGPRRHPSAIKDNGGGLDWVAASARELNGAEDEAITIHDLIEGEYTVRLHFAELDEAVDAGQRVFDVLIDGEEMLSEFDIAATAGGSWRGVVKEFTVDAGMTMDLELRKSDGADLYPLINGVELVASGVETAQGE